MLHIAYTIIKLSKKFDLVLYITFCKICNYKTGWRRFRSTVAQTGGCAISLLKHELLGCGKGSVTMSH